MLQPPEARREAWDGSFLRASRRNQTCRHPDFTLLDSGTMREQYSAVLSHRVVAVVITGYGSPRIISQTQDPEVCSFY